MPAWVGLGALGEAGAGFLEGRNAAEQEAYKRKLDREGIAEKQEELGISKGYLENARKRDAIEAAREKRLQAAGMLPQEIAPRPGWPTMTADGKPIAWFAAPDGRIFSKIADIPAGTKFAPVTVPEKGWNPAAYERAKKAGFNEKDATLIGSGKNPQKTGEGGSIYSKTTERLRALEDFRKKEVEDDPSLTPLQKSIFKRTGRVVQIPPGSKIYGEMANIDSLLKGASRISDDIKKLTGNVRRDQLPNGLDSKLTALATGRVYRSGFSPGANYSDLISTASRFSIQALRQLVATGRMPQELYDKLQMHTPDPMKDTIAQMVDKLHAIQRDLADQEEARVNMLHGTGLSQIPLSPLAQEILRENPSGGEEGASPTSLGEGDLEQ